jgi:predicted anti-sigma-YlaC factor YlaD
MSNRTTSTKPHDDHERARMLLSLADAEPVPAAERSWLESHLEACDDCRGFAQNTGDLIRALRSVPVAADRTLVHTTQMRVRQRARELRRRDERLWLVAASCVLVTLAALVTNFAFWRGFAWFAEHAHVSASLGPVVFVALWIVPALAAGVFLLAHGTHLAEHNGGTRMESQENS